jgi:hypothetical protein
MERLRPDALTVAAPPRQVELDAPARVEPRP